MCFSPGLATQISLLSGKTVSFQVLYTPFGCLPFHNSMTLSHICLVFSFNHQFLFHLDSSSPPFSTSAVSQCCLHTKHSPLAPCHRASCTRLFQAIKTLEILSVYGITPNFMLSKGLINKFKKSSSIQECAFRFLLIKNRIR